MRAFEPQDLTLASYSNILIDKMYTHHTCVAVATPVDVMPPNRVLAIDGRNNAHLANADQNKYIQSYTGCLFWVIGRTSDKDAANVHLAMAHISAPEVTVNAPGLKQKTSFSKDSFPNILFLVNRRHLPKHTKLVAMEDVVIVRQTDEETKRKRESDEAAKAVARAASDAKRAKT